MGNMTFIFYGDCQVKCVSFLSVVTGCKCLYCVDASYRILSIIKFSTEDLGIFHFFPIRNALIFFSRICVDGTQLRFGVPDSHEMCGILLFHGISGGVCSAPFEKQTGMEPRGTYSFCGQFGKLYDRKEVAYGDEGVIYQRKNF